MEIEDIINENSSPGGGVAGSREKVGLPVAAGDGHRHARCALTLVVEVGADRNGVLRPTLSPDLEEFPNPLVTPAQLNGLPGPALSRVAPTGIIPPRWRKPRGLSLQYRPASKDGRAGVFFDDFGTPFVEIQELGDLIRSALARQGDVERVKFELVDYADRKYVTYIDGISPRRKKSGPCR